MNPKTVLVITDYDDVHADAVIECLNLQHIPVYRLNTSDFGIEGTITLSVSQAMPLDSIHGEIANSLRTVAFENVHAVWYRRPGPLKLNPRLAPNAQPYAQEQFRLALQYLQGVLRAKWVNHPLANRRADNKILQLSAARRIGFTIPDTLVTNSPQHLEDFRADHAGHEIIVKDLDMSLANSILLLRGVGTQALPASYIPAPEAVAAAPVVVQPFVPKAFELRCTVIGDNVYAARIDTPDSARLDWRGAFETAPDGSPRDMNKYSPFTPPQVVCDRLLTMTQEFELRFAAIDLIVSPSEDYVFLELNPNGQWLWLQWKAPLPLVEAMVHELSH